MKEEGGVKKKKKKDPNAPKGRQGAFFIFLGERRERIKAANPDFTNPEIAQEVGRSVLDEYVQLFIVADTIIFFSSFSSDLQK